MSAPDLSEKAMSALRNAIGAEHAAIWICGVAKAYAAADRVAAAINESIAEHRRCRDVAATLLRNAGAPIPPSAPAYHVPQPITDQLSAIEVLIITEDDCCVGWRAVLEATQIAEVRRDALDCLTIAATRAARWRITIDDQPAALAFPGKD